MLYIFLFGILLFMELAYLKVADRYDITDKPNQRSSHVRVTLRGGGIIFYLGVVLYFLYSGFQYPWFFAGLTLVVAVSFFDDLYGVRNLYRIGVQMLSVCLLFLELNLYPETWILLSLAAIVIIGTINAYNFMDGINGITGGYSLVILAALAYINSYITSFVADELILFSLMSVIVFNVFNFRKKARCFAGDVGSISIAFIVIFLISSLIIASQSLIYILLLSVYGIDSVLTILHRLYKGENIFEAHRSHLYQVLANEGKIPHPLVSMGYMSVQLMICMMVILISGLDITYQLAFSATVLTVLAIVYAVIKSLFSEEQGTHNRRFREPGRSY